MIHLKEKSNRSFKRSNNILNLYYSGNGKYTALKLLVICTILVCSSCNRDIYKDYPVVRAISYNLLQVDGEETRIGINGPAMLAGIPMSNDETIIILKGEPLVSFTDAAGKEQKNLGGTDTVVEVTGLIPKKGQTAELQFRLIALSLTGSFQDRTGKDWQVKISLSEKREQEMSKAMVRHLAGTKRGTFDSELHLMLRFAFISGAEEKVIDEPDYKVVFTAKEAQWSSLPPVGAARAELGGGFFAVSAKHGGEAGQHATKSALVTQASINR